jgi:peptidoglycan/LPS O-acetylase OafA/YrhL
MLDHAGVSFVAGGYVGVDVFFVLSGFLITGLLLGGVRKHGRISLIEFYGRRARRILPAAVLTLVVTTVVAYELLNYIRARQVAWDSFWAALFAANIHFAHIGTNYFAQGQPPSPIQHYWSLAVEEQFYLVWPALLALTLFGPRFLRRREQPAPYTIGSAAVWRVFAVIGAAGVASLVWSIHSTNATPVSAYFSPFTRAWELALGAFLAVAASRKVRLPAGSVAGWLGAALIVVAAVRFSAATPFPGYAALLPTMGAALIIAGEFGGRPSLGVGRLLATRPMQYVGDRSYALYLWHWPVLVIAMLYEGHQLEVTVNLLLLLGAFLLSIVSYRFIENPIRRARVSPRLSTALAPVAVSAAVIVALVSVSSVDAKVSRIERESAAAAKVNTASVSLVTSTPKSTTLPTVVAAVKAALRGVKVPAVLNPPVSDFLKEAYQFPSGCVPATDDQTSSTICHLGDASATNTIVLFGDSHAQMWMPTILAMAQADSWNVVPLVKSGCVVSSWTGKGYGGTPAATISACHTWFHWALEQAKQLQPDVVLMTGCCGGASGSVETAMKNAYAVTASTLKGVARNVVAIADDDGMKKQPTDCLLAKNATLRSCMTTQTASTLAFNNDLAALARLRHFGFLNTRPWFCYQNQCPMVVGSTIVYRDTGHITQAYALKLVAPFRTAFRQCIFAACPR